MFSWWKSLPLIGFLLFASFATSPSYQLKSYSVGPGGTNNSSSTTYTLQGSLGEQTNSTTAGSTYSANNSSIQTEQLNVPPAPTLSNGSGTYYNQLNCIVNTGSNPSDTTYAIAISTDNFTTTNYVQASTGTIVSTPDYETYSTWGGSSGINVINLSSGTTYYFKVAAKEGLFTNTEFGAVASTATVSPTLSFSVSPNSASLGSFVPGTIVTSSNLSFTYSTNGTSGGSVYVMGKNSGFLSSSNSYTIPAVTGNLSSLSQGFGVQASSPSQTSGGPLTLVSPYNGTGNTVGAESTTFTQMLTSGDAISGATANAVVQVKASGSAPAASDYNEVLTFIASASF